ncbi:MAG: hypothetical protein F4Z18_04430 [Caldilineaceae bacterium SB0666_bin_21]|nr:hypothetical protein [Caldilineaceae bacterium SB0666_bin_21]
MRHNTAIEIPEEVAPYPLKRDRILDQPVSDSGNNFGRLARTGLMDAYIEEMLELPLAGITAKEWTGSSSVPKPEGRRSTPVAGFLQMPQQPMKVEGQGERSGKPVPVNGNEQAD